MGDIQGYSNIDARSFDAVYEVWYQQALPADLRIKIGKQDASDEFAYVEYGASFINNSPGYSPTILALPTYPDPATGVVAFWEPQAGPYLGAGVYDGATQAGIPTGTHGPSTFLGSPSDLYLIAEVGLRYGAAALPGRVGIGYWHHNGAFQRFDGGVDEHADGAYLVWDQTLYQAAAGPRRVGGFFQLGVADEAVSAIETHIGAGVEVIALFPARPRDISGVMASYAGLSDAAAAGFSDDYELAFEAFHAVRVTDWLTLTGDLQYIVNPGGMGADDATVALLRAAIEL